MYIDYTKCKTIDESFAVLEEVKKEYERTSGIMLTLNNFTGAYGNTDFLQRASKYAKEIFNLRNAKNACIGVTGIKKVLLQAYNSLMKDKLVPFETLEEALDYLAKD